MIHAHHGNGCPCWNCAVADDRHDAKVERNTEEVIKSLPEAITKEIMNEWIVDRLDDASGLCLSPIGDVNEYADFIATRDAALRRVIDVATEMLSDERKS